MTKADDNRQTRLRREQALLDIETVRARRVAVKNLTERTKASNLTFDAERRGRLRTRPMSRGGSADSHRPYRTLDVIRSDCSDLRANNPLIRGMVRRLATNIGGDFRHEPETPDEEFNKRAKDLFGAWADDHAACHNRRLFNLSDLSRIAVEEWCWSGGMGVLRLQDGRLQEVEIARLRNPGAAANSKTMLNGWELTEDGAPVAVHIAEWLRDGSSLSTDTVRRRADRFFYLPNMLHIAAGQRVTEPAIAASVSMIEILMKFIHDSAHAATFAASIGLITKTGDPAIADSFLAALRDDQAPNKKADGSAGGPKTFDLETATLWNMEMGESVEQVKPEHPGPQFDTFVMLIARLIGQDLDLPYELAMLDFSQSNFHAARAANSVAWRSFRESQGQLRRRLWQPAYRWRIARAIRAFLEERTDEPVLAPPNVDNWRDVFHACSWTSLGQPVLDPEREIKSAVMAVDARLKSREAAIADIGGNKETTFNQITAEIKDMAQRGIGPVTTPGATDPSTPAATTQTDSDEPEADEPEKVEAPIPVSKSAKPSMGKTEFLIGDKTLAQQLSVAVARGALPGDTARGILEEMVGMSPEDVDRIIGPVEDFEVVSPTGDA